MEGRKFFTIFLANNGNQLSFYLVELKITFLVTSP